MKVAAFAAGRKNNNDDVDDDGLGFNFEVSSL